MKSRLLLGGLIAAAAILAGCSAGAPKTESDTSTTATSLNVSVDKSSLSSTGADTATITVTALNSSNNVVSSVPVSISPDSGVLSPSASTTSSDGVVTGALTIGSDHSNRTINVVITSGSIKKALAIAVTGDQLNATVGTGTSGASTTIQYTFVDAASAGIAGASITVSMAGQSDVVGTTDSSGKYTYTFTMPSASTTVTAVAAGVKSVNTVTPTNGTATIDPATTPSSKSLSANPTTVSTSGAVELRALFIGSSNAPIKNVRVRFQMTDSNSIGGTLSTDASDGTHNVVLSDDNGVARSTYTAGTRGGVITPKICWSTNDSDFATSSSCPNSVSAPSITVVATGVSIAVLSKGVLGEDDDKNIYSLSYVVQVVDASNQPISGSTVTPAVDIPRFYRGIYLGSGAWAPGIYVRSGTAGAYTYALSSSVAMQSCDNEDINRNNVLEDGEDLNNSQALEPYKASVTITPTTTGSDVTDAYGKAYFTLQYGQNYASWEDVVMTFTTTVEGTEGHTSYATGLPVPSATLSQTADPPFRISPYNANNDGLVIPWIVSKTSVTNPKVVYSSIDNFNLCGEQK